MIKLTYDQAVESLERAVADKGDNYVDPASNIYHSDGCTNWTHEGTPSCIVGHVLSYHGGTKEAIGESTVQGLIGAGILEVDSKTGILLSYAQDEQDEGATWRLAVDTAKRHTAYEGF